MNGAERIINIAKEQNGYITTKAVKKVRINTMELTRLVKSKKLD